MTAGAVLVTVLLLLCAVADFAGGRRILSSAMAPGLLVMLGFVANHSDLVVVPAGTSTFPMLAW
jgi:hypothetical protein